jgi:N-acetylglucosamine-6-phosphate deacetylase
MDNMTPQFSKKGILLSFTHSNFTLPDAVETFNTEKMLYSHIHESIRAIGEHHTYTAEHIACHFSKDV